MPISRTFHWHTAAICTVPAAVLAASLLLGGEASPVQPGQAEQAVAEAVATPTTTTLTTPASRVAQGSPVTLTAMVNPATAVGTVQFKDGANLIATAALSSGTAVATQTLSPGSHSLSATFVPGSMAFSTSNAALVTVVVGAADTTTTLTTTPASEAIEGELVTLYGMITPANAAGTVQFRDGAINLGDPVPVSNGVAMGSTSRLRPGSHALSAEFIPANRGDFNPSTSNVSTVTVIRSGAGSLVALDSRDSVLSLDVGTSVLEDRAPAFYGPPGTLDGRQPFDDRRTLLDGRASVLDGRPLLSVVLGVG